MSTPMTTGGIVVSGVTKRFNKTDVAVNDVTFTVERGAVALVGHNGAGKTTLIKMLLGLLQPSAGTVRVLDQDPAAGEFSARRRLGFLPENVAFNAALTGAETLAFYARLKRQPLSDVPRLLEKVGLDPKMKRRVGAYSKGMRQRLGLAQALLGYPRVLLLDEPTTGLDPALRQQFYDIIAELAAGGTIVLLCSHALSELEGRTERVIIMDRGRMIADGSLDALRRIARMPILFRLALSGAMPPLPPGLDPKAVRQQPGDVVELDVPPDMKMAVLQHLAQADTIRDIAIQPPSLDDLYAHFLRSREQAS